MCSLAHYCKLMLALSDPAEVARRQARERYWRNREKRLQQSRDYYQQNREAINERRRNSSTTIKLEHNND